MQEFVDYIIETSNDEPISFLEAIEAVSKSCKEELNYEVQQANIVENFLLGTSSKLNFSCVSQDHAKQVSTVSSFTSALKGDDIDFFNITDCDLNLLVDPKTGRGLFDDECSEDEIQENIKLEPEQCSTATEVISQCVSKEVRELDIVVPSEKVKIEQTKSDNKLTEELSLPKNNRVVLIQIASSPNNASKIKKVENAQQLKSLLSSCEKYDKPPFSYSCLIAMALKNSEYGYLPVSEIYSYITEKFPYFKTAPDGWKNSIRHNLSLNKCFQKLETPLLNGTSRKACLWGLNEAKVARLNEEISKWLKKSPENFEGPRYGESNDLEMSQVTNTDAVTQISGSNKVGLQWTINNESSLKCSQDFKPFRLKNVDDTSIFDTTKSISSNAKIKTEKEDMQFYDPLFTNFNSQAWDDVIESEKKPGILSYFAFSSKGPRISNDSTLSLKTVRASA